MPRWKLSGGAWFRRRAISGSIGTVVCATSHLKSVLFSSGSHPHCQHARQLLKKAERKPRSNAGERFCRGARPWLARRCVAVEPKALMRRFGRKQLNAGRSRASFPHTRHAGGTTRQARVKRSLTFLLIHLHLHTRSLLLSCCLVPSEIANVRTSRTPADLTPSTSPSPAAASRWRLTVSGETPPHLDRED